MNDTYNTLSEYTEGLYKEKGSKFISKCYPVESEDEIKDILSQLAKAYYDSRHICYAWMLGYERDRFRANDDGEPSATAGKPILGQINSNNLTNVLVVVVRYFGGTKLGASGLITAYKTAAADAIENGEIIEMEVRQRFVLYFKYEDMNDIMRITKEEEVHIVKQVFELECAITLDVRLSNTERVVNRIEKLRKVKIDDLGII